MKGRRINYSSVEMDWVKAHCHLARTDLGQLFVERFSRPDVSSNNIKSLCTRKGWTAGAAGKTRNAGKSLIFTDQEVVWMREHAHLTREEIHSEFSATFQHEDITAQQLVSWRKRNGVKTGRTGRFEKGSVPWSKGRKIGSHPNSAKTQFQTGQTPSNILPLWSERIRSDGYVEIKVPEPNPYTTAKTRFVMKHVYLWERENGAVPEGHVLKALDGDKSHTSPENWEAVPRGLLPRLNGKSGRDYDKSPRELQSTILAIAKLEHAARNKGTANG